MSATPEDPGGLDLVAIARERGVAAGATVLVEPGRARTLADVDREVEARAGALTGWGIEPGAVVPLTVAPDARSVLDLLAIWRVGAVPAPLHAGLSEAERGRAEEALAGSSLPARARVVLWTSGTTGSPRGVALSLANLDASARSAARRLSLGPSDGWILSLSPAHVGGLALLIRPFLLGGRILAWGAPDARTLLEILGGGGLPPGARAPPTHVSLVPTQLARLLDAGDAPPPPSLRCVLVGGAHTPRSLLERALAARWPIALTWGTTEMTSQVATAPPPLVRRRPGTVGPPLEGVEVRVAPDGELLARGPTRALAYVGAEAPALSDTEGWYRTGDAGEVDGEGNVWVTGRRSERIVTGGATVDPLEVEEALRAHPAVAAACVAGVPDEEWGEVVAAWIVPVTEALDLVRLDAWVRDRLGPARRPRRWHLGGALPLNANGKVDRGRVRGVLARTCRGVPGFPGGTLA